MKMKNRILRHKFIVDYILKTERFKIIFIFMIFLSIYGSFVLGSNINNYFDSIIISYQFLYFNIFFFLLFFLNTLNVCCTFKKFDFYIIRLKTKRNYLKELIKLVLLFDVIFIVLFLFLYFSILNLMKMGFFEVHNYYNYNISNSLYSLFYLFRYIIILILMSLIVTIINFKYNERISRLLILFLLIGFFIYPFLVGGNIIFRFLPWGYFQYGYYVSFFEELKYSVIYVLFLLLSVFCLFKVTINKMLKVYKYLFINDIFYLIKNRIKLLLFLIFIPMVIFLVLKINSNENIGDILLSVFGNNITFYNNSIIEYLMFLFNIFTFVFIAVDLFIKDIKYEIDYIFLRLNISLWFKNKYLFLILITFFLKFLQYVFVIFLFIIDGRNIDFCIFNIFLLDIFNVCIYQLIIMLCYFSFFCLKKSKYIIFFVCSLILYFIPKNLNILGDKLCYFVPISIILFFYFNYIVNKNKRSFLLIGGFV